MPVIVFPLTAPVKVRVLPIGVDDCTVIPNLPPTLPLKFPPKVNDPLSVSESKHGELVVKLKFVIVTVPSLFSVIDVPNAKTGVFPPLIRLAFQFPLMVLELELLLEPQPISTRPTATTTATANCFIRNPLGLIVQRAPMLDAKIGGCGSVRREQFPVVGANHGK